MARVNREPDRHFASLTIYSLSIRYFKQINLCRFK